VETTDHNRFVLAAVSWSMAIYYLYVGHITETTGSWDARSVSEHQLVRRNVEGSLAVPTGFSSWSAINSSHAVAGVSLLRLSTLQFHHANPFRLDPASSVQQVVTCAVIESIQLDPDEGGATRMRGGVPAVSEAMTAMNKIQ
jgi:hypothetical protein